MKHYLLLLVVMPVLLNGFAQTGPKTRADSGKVAVTGISDYLQKLREAEKSIKERDWTRAASQWKNIIDLNPTEGESWYKLGESYYHTQNYPGAINAFERALTIGAFSPAECAYFIAKCYAQSDGDMKALDWLKRSFDLGYRFIQHAASDSSFAKYSGDSRFKMIVGIPDLPFKSRVEGWRSDLSLFAREIKRRRIEPFKSISEQRFDSAVSTIYQKIPGLNDVQIDVEFMKLAALAGDGHTMIYGFFERPEFQKNLPIDFFFFKEGLYITEADKEFESLLGWEILAFDDKEINEVFDLLKPIVNHDNEIGIKVMGLMRLRTIPILYALGISKNPNEVTLTLRDANGKIKKQKVAANSSISSRKLWDALPPTWVSYAGVKNKVLPLYLKNRFAPYWFEFLPAPKAVYFQYNRVTSEGIPVNHFTDSLFNFIEKNEVDKLVIDIRLNPGGNSRLLPYLLSKIISSKTNERGKLFVMIGRRTYSAAQNFATLTERFTNATFIGEPTGSSPNFIGEDDAFELPYSKLMANVSYLYWQTSWPTDHRQWISPLIHIEPAFQDYVSGKDPALDVILDFKKTQDK